MTPQASVLLVMDPQSLPEVQKSSETEHKRPPTSSSAIFATSLAITSRHVLLNTVYTIVMPVNHKTITV